MQITGCSEHACAPGKTRNLDLKQLQAEGGDPGTTLATAWPDASAVVAAMRATLHGYLTGPQ